MFIEYCILTYVIIIKSTRYTYPRLSFSLCRNLINNYSYLCMHDHLANLDKKADEEPDKWDSGFSQIFSHFRLLSCCIDNSKQVILLFSIHRYSRFLSNPIDYGNCDTSLSVIQFNLFH